MKAVKVADILKDGDYHLGLRLVAGKNGLSREVTVPRIQKPGLALAGYLEQLHPDRVQVLGRVELSYLSTLSEKKREEAIRNICGVDIACFVITRGLPVPRLLIQEANRKGIPVLKTELLSSVLINRITKFLEERLAETVAVHGVLVDVLEVGILLLGKSGIGKSECALDLVLKGHRLVADDMVEIMKSLPSTLIGKGTEPIKYHMEIRGLGIINIMDLFGITAVRDEKEIEVVVELMEWAGGEHERLGLEEKKYSILGVGLPYLRVPVRPGRNMATIIEVAARNHLLKKAGRHTAREFHEALAKRIKGKNPEF
jgi:HPr kinase/phosphorylase